jgi:mono/diheme cytochrome c family protein
MRRVRTIVVLWSLLVLAGVPAISRADAPPAGGTAQTAATTQANPSTQAASRAILDRYCVGCHNQRTRSGNLALDALDVQHVELEPQTWEKVVRKLRAGMMPPAGRPRPDEATQAHLVSWLSGELDRAFDARPDPGRTETFHRLNRTEYQNAVRDVLALQVDIADFLPADDSSYGFDNIAGVLKLSQSLMERYLSAAKTIARLAVGGPPPAVGGTTYRIAPDSEQHDRAEDLPFGTRGGTLVRHFFPQDADYDIRVDLAGSANLTDEHRLDVTIDGYQVKLFTLGPRSSRGSGYANEVDGKLTVRVPVSGGPHDVGVAFYARAADLVEGVREPFPNPVVSGNDGGRGGSMPSVTAVTIAGPHAATGPGDTPSRRRLFVCHPSNRVEETRCARRIATALARRAYRGVATNKDIEVLLTFFEEGRKESGSFDGGVEHLVRRALVDPAFLFRVESEPQPASSSTAPIGTSGQPSPAVYRINDFDLASRLSFFVWSSVPDDRLLDLAAQGRLRDPAVLEREARRMIADPRSIALTKNFAGQWLLLRNIAIVRPGDPFSLAFDQTLREAMQTETELFVDSVIRENRPVIEVLTADYTFLNERLAQHYGVAGLRGSHFRRVVWTADSPRRGILGHASILTVTSHAIRTSPVLRGKWILNNILGTPPPDPPPNVPALPDQRTQAKVKTVRERMSQHRANAVCAACHSMIDPAGFALDNFDAIGRWRTVDESFNPIDASGALPDGTAFKGVADLRDALVRRPDRFATTFVEKMLTYALGRGLEHYDMPAVRRIVKQSAADDYRLHSIVVGIVKSYPFVMRRAETPGSVRTVSAQ